MFSLIFTIMKKGILRSIGKGIINGFPLIQSIVQNVKGVKEEITIPLDSNKPVERKSFDIIAIITECVIVVLIIALVMGKITVIDLEKIINLIK